MFAWSAWLISIALLWGQHQLRVVHPWALASLVFFLISVLASFCGLLSALWCVARGPRRLAAVGWGLACIAPVGFWAALAAYVLEVTAGGALPSNFLSDVARPAIASLMELQADCTYRSMESDRLVMFYDDRTANPGRDLETMDRHVARLEKITSSSLRAKIHWVRGELLGQRHMTILAVALGSSRSPDDWDTADDPNGLSVDRHELAHGVVHQIQPTDADAPTLLIEGWADAQSGTSYRTRAEWAKQSRDLWRERTGAGPDESYLADLTGPAWYHRIDGPVYNVGGALAEFIIRTYGVHRFLDLYFACRPGNFDVECLARLGTDRPALESAFWADVEKAASDAVPAK